MPQETIFFNLSSPSASFSLTATFSMTSLITSINLLFGLPLCNVAPSWSPVYQHICTNPNHLNLASLTLSPKHTNTSNSVTSSSASGQCHHLQTIQHCWFHCSSFHFCCSWGHECFLPLLPVPRLPLATMDFHSSPFQHITLFPALSRELTM